MRIYCFTYLKNPKVIWVLGTMGSGLELCVLVPLLVPLQMSALFSSWLLLVWHV